MVFVQKALKNEGPIVVQAVTVGEMEMCKLRIKRACGDLLRTLAFLMGEISF